jgi:2-acylglycerol O-acyltransferase 1
MGVRTHGSKQYSKTPVSALHVSDVNLWLRTGVPQVVLPAWQDCYENAARAEWLQIGVHANKRSAPNIEENELTKAITAVLSLDVFRKNAAELARKISRTGGRVEAAKLIVNIATRKLRAEDAIVQDAMASLCSSKALNVQEVCNEKGKVLVTICAPTPWRFP